MTTRAMFDTTGSHEHGVVTYDALNEILAGPSIADLLPPGTIGDQTDAHGAGVPISAIRRGMLGPLMGRSSNYSVTATSFAELDSANLAGVMVCTGRPVLILIAAGVQPASALWISVAMDGTEVTGRGGMAYSIQSAVAGLWLSPWAIVTPRPGPRRFAMVARVNTGTGSIFSDTSGNLVQMTVLEL